MVLLDVHTPGIDGFSLAGRVKGSPEQTGSNILRRPDLERLLHERVDALLERQVHADADRAVSLRGVDLSRPFVGGLHQALAPPVTISHPTSARALARRLTWS
jgi:hypothetical protein